METLISRTRLTGRAIHIFLISLLRWVRRDFIWGLLIVPFLLIAAVYLLSEADFLGWSDRSVFKSLMEIVHPALLAASLLVFLFRLWWGRDKAFAFLAILAGFLLGREIIGQGSSAICYAGLIGLMIYGSRHPDRISALLDSRWATSFLGMCFVCYLSSQLIDRGIVKRIGWLILWDTSWKPPYGSNIEEALESLGGFFVLLTSIVIRIPLIRRDE